MVRRLLRNREFDQWRANTALTNDQCTTSKARQVFEETPKHVLYALVREFAGLCDGDSADRSWETGAWLKLAREHIAILRDGGIIQ